MATILLIHGINNQNNSKEKIECAWEKALKIGARAAGLSIPNDACFKAAFYGDILYQETESWNQNTEKPGIQAMSTGSPSEDFVDDNTAALYFEFQRKLNINDKSLREQLEPDDDLSAYTSMAQGIHKRWLKAIARAIENVHPTKNKYIIRCFLSQAAAYLHKPGLKEKIDNLVKGQIFDDLAGDKDVVIISHSLGTIVAYSLMLSLQSQITTNLFLTAGSPLGTETVKYCLGPPLICLSNANKWVNAADQEDFVALYPQLDSQTFGCDRIVNLSNLDNGEKDAHDIEKYLSHAEVAKEVALALHDRGAGT